MIKSKSATILAMVLISMFANAAHAEKILRWARGDGVLTWDPHGAWTLASFNGYRQVYEPLINHDTHYNLVPGLAQVGNWSILRPGISSCEMGLHSTMAHLLPPTM